MHICKLKWDGRSHFNILKPVYNKTSICGTSSLSREVCRFWQKTSPSQRGVPFLAEDFAFFGFGVESNSLLCRASANKTVTRVSRGDHNKLRYPSLGGFILIVVAFPTCPMIAAISCYLCIGTYILTVLVSQTSCNNSVLKQSMNEEPVGRMHIINGRAMLPTYQTTVPLSLRQSFVTTAAILTSLSARPG